MNRNNVHEPPRTSVLLAGGIVLALILATAPLMADQVILDDLIVDGSICAGLDCVNGESFGFDTIRLKENNLRIRFQDTSSTSSFPSRDWQITPNDSANGGLNKFSIDDIDGGRTPFTIEGNAPSHSLYVDDGGRLGLGTSTPVADIHVKSGNTPTLRLEQDGSSGFAPQTWDVASNEANFFIRDATNGSTLPFRIRPGAPTSAIDIASDGNVGIGTSTPGSKLTVDGDVAMGSSRHMKHDLTPASGAQVLGGLRGLAILNWRYRDDPVQAMHLGPVAEDFHATFGLGANERYLSALDLGGVALAAIQELSKLVEEREREIGELKLRLAALEALVQVATE